METWEKWEVYILELQIIYKSIGYNRQVDCNQCKIRTAGTRRGPTGKLTSISRGGVGAIALLHQRMQRYIIDSQCSVQLNPSRR